MEKVTYAPKLVRATPYAYTPTFRKLLSFNSLPSYRIEELVGGIDEDEGLLQRREIARELARRDEEAVKVNKRRGPISRVSCPAIVPTRPSNPMACDPFFGEE
eukprot:TRINITY_DN14985_c0_g1_i18.p1 TRINITY_DN14985_c0_g1~~TRINITY_DN14985_c0_g1_i18.p1  ORF type:complete len:103 (+),score=28.47 TRINITY_DN14985_c0_g1_i18:163-471(+)